MDFNGLLPSAIIAGQPVLKNLEDPGDVTSQPINVELRAHLTRKHSDAVQQSGQVAHRVIELETGVLGWL